MKSKKLVAMLLLAFAMVGFSGCTVSIGSYSSGSGSASTSSSIEESSSEGENSSGENSGDEEKDEVIKISTEEELFAVADDLTASYELQNDITLTKEWNTLGDDETPFSGVFNGNGYTLTNMTVKSDVVQMDGTAAEYLAGMFGTLTGTLKNVEFKDFSLAITSETIDGTSFAETAAAAEGVATLDIHAGIVAANKGTIDAVIASVTVSVTGESKTVEEQAVKTRIRMGGITGKNSAAVTNCEVSGSVTGENTEGYIRAGGIAGYGSAQGIISYCNSSAAVSGTITVDAKMNIGGIIGNIECGTVENCTATGDITVTNTDTSASYGGGLIGYIDNEEDKYDDMTVTVKNNTASGDVTVAGKKGYAGGLIGGITSLASESAVKTITVENNAAEGTASGNKAGNGLIGRVETDSEEIVVVTDNQSVQADDYTATEEEQSTE